MKKLDDQKFRHILRPLSSDEFAALEEEIVKKKGITDPLIVWKSKNILVDGHHRYDICLKYDYDYSNKIEYQEFKDDNDAIAFIYRHQLARRNFKTRAEQKYYIGKLYNLTAGVQGHNLSKKSQNDTSNVVSDLSDTFKLGRATIFRYSNFADNVDKIENSAGNDVVLQLLSGDIQSTEPELNQVANMDTTDQKVILEEADKTKSVKKAISYNKALQSSQDPKSRATTEDYEVDDDKLIKVKELFKNEDFRQIKIQLTKNKKGTIMVNAHMLNNIEVSSKLQLLDMLKKRMLSDGGNHSATWSFEPDGIRVGANVKFYIDHSVAECHLKINLNEIRQIITDMKNNISIDYKNALVFKDYERTRKVAASKTDKPIGGTISIPVISSKAHLDENGHPVDVEIKKVEKEVDKIKDWELEWNLSSKYLRNNLIESLKLYKDEDIVLSPRVLGKITIADKSEINCEIQKNELTRDFTINTSKLLSILQANVNADQIVIKAVDNPASHFSYGSNEYLKSEHQKGVCLIQTTGYDFECLYYLDHTYERYDFSTGVDNKDDGDIWTTKLYVRLVDRSIYKGAINWTKEDSSIYLAHQKEFTHKYLIDKFEGMLNPNTQKLIVLSGDPLSELEKHMIIKEYESSPKPTQSIKDKFPKPPTAPKSIPAENFSDELVKKKRKKKTKKELAEWAKYRRKHEVKK